MPPKRPSSAPTYSSSRDTRAAVGGLGASTPTTNVRPPIYRPSSGRPRFTARKPTAGLSPECFAKALNTVTAKIDRNNRRPGSAVGALALL